MYCSSSRVLRQLMEQLLVECDVLRENQSSVEVVEASCSVPVQQ